MKAPDSGLVVQMLIMDGRSESASLNIASYHLHASPSEFIELGGHLAIPWLCPGLSYDVGVGVAILEELKLGHEGVVHQLFPFELWSRGLHQRGDGVVLLQGRLNGLASGLKCPPN